MHRRQLGSAAAETAEPLLVAGAPPSSVVVGMFDRSEHSLVVRPLATLMPLQSFAIFARSPPPSHLAFEHLSTHLLHLQRLI